MTRALLLSLGVAACTAADPPMAPRGADDPSPESDRVAAFPPITPTPYTVTKDIKYGPNALHKFDLYHPVGSVAPHKAIVYFHGQTVTKNIVIRVAPFAGIDSGWSIIAPNFRDYQQSGFAAWIGDYKLLFRYLRANAATLKLDPMNLVAWGSSEGAHMTSLGATSCKNRAVGGNGTANECPTATVSWFGITDPPMYDPDLITIGCAPYNKPPMPSTYSPLTYVATGAPIAPMRIENGLADCKMPWLQAARLDSALTATAHISSLVLVPGAGHGITNPPWTDSVVYRPTLGWVGKAFRRQLP